jgi:hypothetical protein
MRINLRFYDIILFGTQEFALIYPLFWVSLYCAIIYFMSSCAPEKFGADPVTIQWRVVRGDTATLKVEFFEDNEIDYYDTSDWDFSATAYDQSGNVLDELTVNIEPGYVVIEACADVTKMWGTGYSSMVAELPFDLQIKTEEHFVWTPVIGTIYVIGDVTPGGSL